MKRLFQLCFLAAMSLTMGGCIQIIIDDNEEICAGPTVIKTIDLKDFDAIESLGMISIIMDDSIQTPRMEGDSALVEHVKINVKKDKRLCISQEPMRHFTNVQQGVQVYLPAQPNLRMIELSGACEATIGCDINVKQLNIELSGSSNAQFNKIDGDLLIELSGGSELTINENLCQNADAAIHGNSKIDIRHATAKTIDLDMSGASEAQITGRAERVLFEISGCSEVDATQLDCTNASISTSGCGEASIGNTQEMTANASGNSTIKYKGSPLKNSISTSGASEIMQL